MITIDDPKLTTDTKMTYDNPCPTVVVSYSENGKVAKISISWRNEFITIEASEQNAPTREFQRADEVVQGLMNQYYGR